MQRDDAVPFTREQQCRQEKDAPLLKLPALQKELKKTAKEMQDKSEQLVSRQLPALFALWLESSKLTAQRAQLVVRPPLCVLQRKVV